MLDRAQTARLLLVDDDQVNRIAFTRALGKLDTDISIVTTADGLEALEYLNGERERNQGVLPPVIVLLDIYMPRMNGPEFCKALKNDPCFNGLIVYAFGTSDMPAAIRADLDSHIAGYLTKDKPLETLTAVLQSEASVLVQ